MKILIVGAGAVGLVYGRHLALGGAEVSFLVKPKYAEDCRKGFALYPLNKGRTAPAERFEGFGVCTSAQEAGQHSWDMIWLCVSSTALRAGDWLKELLAVRGQAVVVGMQPGVEDRAHVLQWCPEEKLVWGLISMISYQSPLPGEDRGEGVAYWFPPLGPSPFGGAQAKAVVKALKVGGCPAKVSKNITSQGNLGAAAFIPQIAALEGAGWRFDGLRQGPWLGLSCEAARQSVAVVAAQEGIKVPFGAAFLRPLPMKVLVRVAPWVIPLPLEVYLKYHFVKVGDQTRDMLGTYARLGKTHSLPVNAIEALRGRALGAVPKAALLTEG